MGMIGTSIESERSDARTDQRADGCCVAPSAGTRTRGRGLAAVLTLGDIAAGISSGRGTDQRAGRSTRIP